MISLRTLDPDDRTTLLTWRNLPEVAAYMYSDHVITQEEHERWFDRVLASTDDWYRIIELDGAGVGLVNLSRIDREARRCSWAFYLASPAVRGRGVGSWVEYHAVQTAFATFGLNKLTCEVFVTNEAVVEMHEGFGFRREGYFRQHVVKAGQPVDVVALGLLRQEWELIRPSVEARLTAKGLL